MFERGCWWILTTGAVAAFALAGPAGAQQTDQQKVIVQTYQPMTRSQRAHEYIRNLFSPVSFIGTAASAGIGQWRNTPKEWGQGGDAFGFRAASSFGQHIVRESLTSGLATVLHEDDRYFPSHELSKKSRILYAVESTFLARATDGSRKFSFSKIGGMAGASFIARAWQPPSTDSIRSAETNLIVSIGVTAGINVAREFLKK